MREDHFVDTREFISRLYEVADKSLKLPSRATMERNLRSWESGTTPRGYYKKLLATALGITVRELFGSEQPRASATVDDMALPSSGADADGRAPWLPQPPHLAGDLAELGGTALFQALVGPPAPPDDGQELERLAAALVGISPVQDGQMDLAAFASRVAAVRRQFQRSQYRQVIGALSVLLPLADHACDTLDGDERLLAHALASQVYHVAGSVLLKQEDQGLAWLAADRSVRAAQASGNALALGASTRVIARALMDGQHHQVAADTARTAAERMDSELEQPSAEELSVYGSLLLCGAVAAAHLGQRHVVGDFLDEAEQAAQRLGHDGNHEWTAFGPANVRCHRVNVALRLGDAGTAIDHARHVALEQLPTPERRGTVLIDTAEAFYMWGKHDRALHVLRVAEEIAPQEVTSRPAALRLVRDIAVTAPPTVRRAAQEYATLLGVPA
ncbi:XRE family transcriptional regulator [Nonomuraea sp. NPDC003707]